MASLSFYSQFETNLVSNRKAIELLLQLKSAKAYGKNYIKVKPHLVRHLLRNRLLMPLHVSDTMIHTAFFSVAVSLRCNSNADCITVSSFLQRNKYVDEKLQLVIQLKEV